MSTGATGRDHIELMLAVFSAVERRDAQRFTELVQPDFEIHWPPSLPYGGTYRDLDIEAQQDRPHLGRNLEPAATERGRAADGPARRRRQP